MKNDRLYQQLLQHIWQFKRAVVAFFGAVDSTLLVYLAYKELGDNMIAITVKMPYVPDWEIEEALFLLKNTTFLTK